MNPTAPVSTPRVAIVPPSVVVGIALAAMPLLPIWLSGVVGYDDGTMRAVAMLVELAMATALGGGVRAAWAEVPRALRVAVGVWLAASVVTTATALHVAPAVFRTAEWAVHLIFGTTVWCWLREDSGRADGLLRALAAGSLAFVVWNAWTWCSAVWAGASPEDVRNLPLGNIRYVGFYAMAAITLGLVAWPDAGRRRAVWSVLWILGWTVLWWTGGRGSVAATFVAVGLWMGMVRPSWRVVLLLTSGAAVGLGLSLVLPDAGQILDRVSQTLAVGENASSGRADIWNFLLDATAARPLRGLGPDGVAFALAKHTQAHNTAVQAFVEWGAVGALAFGAMLLGILAGALRAGWRATCDARGPAVAAAAAFWVAASLNGLLDGLFYGAGTLVMLAVAAAVAFVPAAPRAAPEPHPWRGGAVAVLAAVAVFHLAASGARFAGGTPEPSAFRVRLAMTAPTSFRTTELLWWGKDWAEDHPADALAVATWGQRHSRLPWSFYDLEADLHLADGDTTGAHALMRRGAAAKRATFIGHAK